MEKSENKLTTITPSKKWSWILHAVPWGVIMCLPLLFLWGFGVEHLTWNRYIDFAMTLFVLMLLFYVNYYYLIGKYLFTRQTVKYLLINLVLIVSLMAIDHFLDGMLHVRPPEHQPSSGPGPGHGPPPFENNWLIRIAFTIVSIAFNSLIVAVSVAFKMTSSWYATETARRELEQSRSEAELQNLKTQLNPHFLFNTLNNIYSLIAFSPEKAQEAVHDLSRLLRYVMYESCQPFVPLEKEMDFLRNYIELMRIRLPEHVELKTDISNIIPGTLIAPLLFISLVENAFKHGVSNNKPSFIHVSIHQEKQQVICEITNSDFHKSADQDKSGSGIGLDNLYKRLELLYPGHHLFECGSKEDIYTAHLSITINNSEK